ncbi:MAG: hypothetical protein HPY65_17575 [Syntrophaceae bacterium]|nr:hypothetical protein [Syntrophaceae bacterium]
MNEHKFVCHLCGAKQMHDPAKGPLPPGWKMKGINDEALLLCKAHAYEGHWHDGPSPAVQELYRKKFGQEIIDY